MHVRMSKLFSQTLREAPTGVEVSSHQLLIRAGFIRQLAAGIFSYLPLARRSLTKIETIMREEIDAIGGQELTMPVVHPAEIWKETGRWYTIGPELGRFHDRSARDMVLAMTHEEVVADLVRKEVHSYRQLPLLLYHIQTKWRDDPRPRAGLIRVREFTMKDSYSLDTDWEGLDRQYRAHYQAYFNIFSRCALPVVAVLSDVGMMGGTLAHEFMYLTPIAEDTVLLCSHCGYAANRQIATARKAPAGEEVPRPLEKVATPRVSTIDQLVVFLGVPPTQLAKTVGLVATTAEAGKPTEMMVLAVVRGDMEVNETKVANALRAIGLRPAQAPEMIAVGLQPGYISPVGVSGVSTIVDDLIPHSPNLVAGANEVGYHFRNVNYGRDFRADIVRDIAVAQAGDECPQCGSAMTTSGGIEVGNIFKLGTRYSDAMGCKFLDRDGTWKPVVMGSYGIGTGRLLASIAEEHHDASGLRWPVTVAPYHVHLVALASADSRDPREIADRLYVELVAEGIEVLLDDRETSAGVKFMDADLIGLPLRVTVSQRSLAQGGVELKSRTSTETTIVRLNQAVARLQTELSGMIKEIARRLVPMPMLE